MRVWQRTEELGPSPDGSFRVDENTEYSVECEVLLPTSRHLVPQPKGSGQWPRFTLFFDNYVGLARIGTAFFDVRSRKMAMPIFLRMLEDVTRNMADLAFGYNSPTAMSSERDEDPSGDFIRYHALAYLRHAIGADAADGGLQGQFELIARHPHRRTETEWSFRPVHEIANVGPRGLLSILAYPAHLARLPHGSGLRATSLAKRLSEKGDFFPREVLAERRVESFDTHENRLVRRVLEIGIDLIDVHLARPPESPDLTAELGLMRSELARMLAAGFLSDVSDLSVVPSQSTVLQQRDGYRQFRDHYVRLHQASRLGPAELWQRLIDLKDCALLYEIWSFLQVKRVLDVKLGPPARAHLYEASSDARKLMRVDLPYADGDVSLHYNRTYPSGQGSYSVPLRPDVTIARTCADGVVRHLLLDAKLRFEGEKLSVLGEQDSADSERSHVREDLYKMHTYRDAIRDSTGAFILYPGTTYASFPETPDSPEACGVGAIPLVPGGSTDELERLISLFMAL